MRSPLLAIARKKFIQIRRDKATIYMVFIFPVMMLILYGFGIRYDVKYVPMTILDQDRSMESRQYIERFCKSTYFRIVRNVDNYDEVQDDIDRGGARLGMVIPPNFGERISSNREATVQVILDGSDNNTATISLAYFTSIQLSEAGLPID
jgi:ABC-2 type transport system permease protein